MNTYRIEIGGIDVTDWIVEKPVLPFLKGGVGEVIQIPNISLIGDNTDKIFSPLHPYSIFQTDWVGMKVEIFENDLMIYDGEVRNSVISDAGRDCVIETTAKVNRELSKGMPIYIGDIKTFSEHSQDIYEDFGIEVDPVSYAKTKELQEDYLLQCRVNIGVQQKMSLLQSQQWLTNVGICRHWFQGNTAYMEMYDPNQTRYPLYTFTDSDVLDIMEYNAVEKTLYNGYTVVCANGILAQKAGDSKVPTIDADSDKAFIFSTPETGYNFGDKMIEVSEVDKYRLVVQFTKSSYAEWLSMNTVFTFQSDRYGFTKVFEVVGLDKSSNISIKVTGETF